MQQKNLYIIKSVENKRIMRSRIFPTGRMGGSPSAAENMLISSSPHQIFILPAKG